MKRVGNGCQIRDLFVALIMQWATVASCKKWNVSYWGKFDPNFGQGKQNLVK